MTTAAAISLQQVSVRYGRHEALRDITVTIPTGALVAVAGPNGAGKSTLLKLIAGLLKPRAGTLQVNAPLAYLPQAATLQREMPIDVMQAVCTAFWPRLGNSGAIDATLRQQARAALHEVGLLGCEDRQIAELSGGQFQRLLFARLILQDAPIMLLDEPFAAVDTPTIKLLLQLIKGWHQEGRTILCVLHDLPLVQRVFPTLLLLDKTCRAFGPTAELASLLSDELP